MNDGVQQQTQRVYENMALLALDLFARGMEQARRSALAHHVHRTALMGPRVLINGIWYYTD